MTFPPRLRQDRRRGEIIAQGGAQIDLHPDVQTAAAHVRRVYDLGVTYFDCARLYWDGHSRRPPGIGLEGVRNNVFLTTKTHGRTAKAAEEDLETSLHLLKTDYVDLWQVHSIQDDVDTSPCSWWRHGGVRGGEEGRQVPLYRVYQSLRSRRPRGIAAGVRRVGHGADAGPRGGSRLSELRKQTALPVAVDRGVGVQAMKVFGKAYLLRSLAPANASGTR